MQEIELRRLQRAILYTAKEVKRVCDKHHIPYSVDGGTMIGMIRHGGFIPWDDDFDIGMLRKDYERFLRVCETELGEEFELITWKNNEQYCHGFAKVLLKGTKALQRKNINNAEPDCVFVDIFPYDDVPDDHKRQKGQKMIMYLFTKILHMQGGFADDPSWGFGKKVLYGIARMIGKIIPHHTVVNVCEKQMAKYTSDHANVVSCMVAGMGYSKLKIPKIWYSALEEIAFEDTTFSCMKAYDSYLKKLYGDYMKLPPEEKRVSHDIVELYLERDY